MYLSKSKFCSGVQCYKKLWLDEHYPEVASDTDISSVLENGTMVGEYAKNLFGEHIDINFSENLSDMINSTNALLLNKKIVLTEASFSYDNNFCSVDILVKDDDKLEVYEVKSSTSVSDIYVYDLSYQVYILKKLGYNVDKACVVTLNSSYVRHGDLEINKLFKINDLTDKVYSNFSMIEEKISLIKKNVDVLDEPSIDIGSQCFKFYDCPYFKYCTMFLPQDNVFNLRSMRSSKKLELYNSGFISFYDLLKSDIDSKYKQQIDFELNNLDDFCNKENIHKFMDTLYYPLYFLDFETFQQAIPKYDGISPYMQVPFQYSLHYIEHDGGELMHKEFLAQADVDPRRDLAVSLINDIPSNACVLAYNMSFEKSVIKKLAEIYPDLSDKLMNIYNNIYDLMIPFKNRDYYTKNMHGSYSIKYVLPALFPGDPSLDYHNLDMVHNGSEAMNIYSELGKYSKEEQLEIRKNLLKYCCLDTYAMVKIWDFLKKI